MFFCLSESRINQLLKSIQRQGYNFLNAKLNKNPVVQLFTTALNLNSPKSKSLDYRLGIHIRLKIWKNDSAKALVIASIYRHPSEDINQFVFDFSDCLEKLSNKK